MRTTQTLMHAVFRAGLTLSLSLTGCAADVVTEADEPPDPAEIDESHQSVIGGTEAGDCQWPTTVRVDPSQCTGTLIHRRVVTTAAHCLYGTTQTIGFGARGAATSFSVSARCVGGARGSSGGNTAKDWAYCILPEDPRIAKLPVTPPVVGCEQMLVKAGTSTGWVVGYGATTPRGGVGGKRQVEVTINQFNKVAPGTVDVGDRYKGACHGDSGGPLYVKLTKDGKDYGFRTLGSTSGAGGPNCDCTCSTTYINIQNHVKAIETNENIDVTPCTDAEGNWQPGPDCVDFEAAPQSGSGTFPMCNVQRTVGPIETCGSSTVTGGGDGGVDAGGVADAGLGVDGGAAADAGARADAGATTGMDGGYNGDAAIAQDAGGGGSVTPRDAALPQDAGVALTDGGFGDAAPTGVSMSPVTGGTPQPRGHRDSGCSAGRSRGGAGTFGLLLTALALGRTRRRRQR